MCVLFYFIFLTVLLCSQVRIWQSFCLSLSTRNTDGPWCTGEGLVCSGIFVYWSVCACVVVRGTWEKLGRDSDGKVVWS